MKLYQIWYHRVSDGEERIYRGYFYTKESIVKSLVKKWQSQFNPNYHKLFYKTYQVTEISRSDGWEIS